MKFSEQLQIYMRELSCTSKELAAASGLSEASISRYRNGTRVPVFDSDNFNALVNGLLVLGQHKEGKRFSEAEIKEAFRNLAGVSAEEHRAVVEKLNKLISLLQINITDLARSMYYDASFLVRVRTGEKRFSDVERAVHDIAKYVAERHFRRTDQMALAELMGCEVQELACKSDLILKLESWMRTNPPSQKETMDHFLKYLDAFDLNDYIASIHFDEIKVPSMPVQFSGAKTYYGLEAMRQAELDFFKSTVLAKNMDPIFMYSNMEMADIAKDKEWVKKFMLGLAVSLKKGLKITMVHDLDRPYEELMLGLEGWIPLYMTGQVEPYYLPDRQNDIFQSLTYVSGQVALAGECLKGHHNEGKYEFSRNRQTVKYYRQKADGILSFAKPLMQIFRLENEEKYAVWSRCNVPHRFWRNILYGLPIYTMSEELLADVLEENHVEASLRERIGEYRRWILANVEDALRSGSWEDELLDVAQMDVTQEKVHLNLTHFLTNAEITYGGELLQRHWKEQQEFVQCHPGYNVKYTRGIGFKNIDICMDAQNTVVISKKNVPAINFVIQHPILVEAICNYKPLLQDENKESLMND